MSVKLMWDFNALQTILCYGILFSSMPSLCAELHHFQPFDHTVEDMSCGELYKLSQGSGRVLTELVSREEDGWGL